MEIMRISIVDNQTLQRRMVHQYCADADFRHFPLIPYKFPQALHEYDSM